MASCYFGNEQSEALKFACLLNNLTNDIISGRVRLIEADHRRETHTEFPFATSMIPVTSLTGEETLSIRFHRSSQEEDQ